MLKDTFNQTSSSISSKPVGEAQGFATATHADLNNDMVGLYLRFLSPDEIAKIKRVSWGYYQGANQALNHYRLIDKGCQEKVGLKFLKLELSHLQNFLLVQNSQEQSQVYAWGANRLGQLGLGHKNSMNRPTLLSFLDSLAHWTLNNMVASGDSTFAIFQNAQGQSQVYAWGDNRAGQLGLGHKNSMDRPTLLPFPDSLANWTLNNIVASGTSTFAIFQNAQGQSQVYAWGTNTLGQLGLGHDNAVNRPSLLPFPDSLANWTLSNMVANGASIFAIFQNAEGQNQVYAWGANGVGQLGLGHDNDVNRPTLLPFPDSLAHWTLNNMVASGASIFAIFRNAERQSQVYAWGYNGFGRLGLGHDNNVNRPSLLPFPDSLAHWTLNNMVASGGSTFAIFQNVQGQSQVYAWGATWGANGVGRLGLGHNHYVNRPTLLPFPDSLANWTLNNMVANGGSTFAIFQNAQGQSQVYAWGYNRFGRLGLGHDNDVNRPTLLPFPDSLANWTLNNIVCREHNFFAIFQNPQGQKQVYIRGANEFGQLGLGHNNRVHTPTLIPFFKGATAPGQLPLQRRKILNSLTRNSEAAFSSTAVSSNQSSRSCELVDRITQLTAELSREIHAQGIHLTPLSFSSSTPSMVNSYLSSQSSLSQTASSSLTAGSEQKCVTVAQPQPAQKLG